jgi:hypothetical protein
MFLRLHVAHMLLKGHFLNLKQPAKTGITAYSAAFRTYVLIKAITLRINRLIC